MKYQVDTIPVWEALEYQGTCMLCTLQAKTEAGEVERVLGASVMEPEVRVKTNELGICQKHQQMMFPTQNRLGHALLMDTHAAEVLRKLSAVKEQAKRLHVKDKGLFKNRNTAQTVAVELRTLTGRCIVCDTLQAHMQRYFYTLVYLWKNDSKFKAKFTQSNGLCIPHTADLIEAASSQLSTKEHGEFSEACLSLLCNPLAEDAKDLHWFTQKFDYKNQDKPWGNSKNALERTVNRLRGYCLGDIPYEKSKR
jgi:hypothetical protein